MGLIKDEPDSGSEALDSGTEEGNVEVEDGDLKIEESDIKIEESEDIKEENPEAITVPPIQPKPEVSVWGLCIWQQRFVLPGTFTATKREIQKIHFN